MRIAGGLIEITLKNHLRDQIPSIEQLLRGLRSPYNILVGGLPNGFNTTVALIILNVRSCLFHTASFHFRA
jgi:hypothetical protein